MKRLPFLLLFFYLLCSVIQGQTDSVLVDFGPASGVSPMPWNNITSVTSGDIPNLVDAMGFPTGKGFRITDRFNTTNSFGTTSPDPSLGYPVSATLDCFFGNTQEFGGLTLPQAGFELYGLDTATTYTLELFASRNHTINLQTKYTITGLTTDTLYLNAASNTSNVVISAIKPDVNGVVAVSLTSGPDNTSSNGFYYINALKLFYPHIPSTGTPRLELSAPSGGEFWQAGKTPDIVWYSEVVQDVLIEYSTDLGTTWVVVDSVKHYHSPYGWSIPNTPSKQCLVRISSDTLVSVSAHPFEISTDSTTCTVVVLGSSTAAGAGATPSDSSWVSRYRHALQQQNTRFEVVNLARGGYTTYHILPTGTPLPPHVTVGIDTLRNITKALSYNPYLIILNMPSNDAAYGFPAGEQMVNFRTLYDAALAGGAGARVCTPQPRNFSDPAKREIQHDLYDSIMAAFGQMAIDFWTGTADSAGFIIPMYDSGDGIHLNNMGHRKLFEKVMEARTDTPGCAPYIFVPFIRQPQQAGLSVYPNPFGNHITLELPAYHRGNIILTLIDLHGRVLAETTMQTKHTVNQQITWHHGVASPQQPRITGLIITLTDNRGNTVSREMVKLVQGSR
jgi:lysophospholipase L1-like esterase